MSKMDTLKPAVPRTYLLLLAFFAWFGVGILLMSFAYSWLSKMQGMISFILAACGGASAFLIYHLGFRKIAGRNIARILPMEGEKCLFSFIAWKSYLIIIAMITMGSFLRHLSIPRYYLAVLYSAIGLALMLASLRYLRVYINETRKKG